MAKTFQEQMLQLGLVGKKQVNEVKKEQYQKKKEPVKQTTLADENALLRQQELEKKQARVRQLNLEREAKLQKRADAARIRQLISEHKVAKDDTGVAFRFNHRGTIQRVLVEKTVAENLGKGRLAIVVLADQKEIIPREIAEKIQAIDKKVFVSIATPAATPSADPDDPYAAFTVPDDLMW